MRHERRPASSPHGAVWPPGATASRGPRAAGPRKPFRPRRAPPPVRARHAALGLAAVAALGVAVRLLPLASFAVWGSDTGEYHRLTEELVRQGRLSLDYPGWGVAYPWFPGLYSVAGAVSAMTGLDARASLEVLVPALAGLAALAAALLAHALTRDARAALLAGAVLAVAMPAAFATSHAMPGALGHLFLLGGLLLAWAAPRDRGALVAALLVAAALVATHHLSTYMFLVALGGMVLLRALLVRHAAGAEHAAPLAVLAAALAMAVAWWLWAQPVRDDIAPKASALGVPGLAALALLALAALALLPRWRAGRAWAFQPRYPDARRGLRIVGGMFAAVLAGSAVVGFVRVPGTSVQVTPLAVLWFLPLVAVVAFAFLGSGLAKFRPGGAWVYGWSVAQLASFGLAMAAGSVVLLPYRHTEYLLEPIALLAGLGLAAAVAHARARSPRLGAWAAAGVVGLLLANAAAAYPPPSVLAGFTEGTTRGEMAAVRWAGEHVALAPDAVIAADHRMSSMLFGYAGLNATWEYAPRTFEAPSFDEARAEMLAVHAPSGVKRVDYVFLSRAMREHLALAQWDAAQPLSPAAQAKFDADPHYQAACRGDEVTIYRVVWDTAPAPAAGPGSAPPPCAG